MPSSQHIVYLGCCIQFLSFVFLWLYMYLCVCIWKSFHSLCLCIWIISFTVFAFVYFESSINQSTNQSIVFLFVCLDHFIHCVCILCICSKSNLTLPALVLGSVEFARVKPTCPSIQMAGQHCPNTITITNTNININENTNIAQLALPYIWLVYNWWTLSKYKYKYEYSPTCLSTQMTGHSQH